MSPALEAAMATIVPTVRTAARAPGSVQPAAAKMDAMPSSVTSAMPDVGCDETPTMPTMRAATATKSTPKTPTPAAHTARWRGPIPPAKTPGTRPATSTTNATPPSTKTGGRSRSDLSSRPEATTSGALLVPNPRATAVKAAIIDGRPRRRVRIPAVATAPAPT
jgi:hypothetical protein